MKKHKIWSALAGVLLGGLWCGCNWKLFSIAVGIMDFASSNPEGMNQNPDWPWITVSYMLSIALIVLWVAASVVFFSICLHFRLEKKPVTGRSAKQGLAVNSVLLCLMALMTFWNQYGSNIVDLWLTSKNVLPESFSGWDAVLFVSGVFMALLGGICIPRGICLLVQNKKQPRPVEAPAGA